MNIKLHERKMMAYSEFRLHKGIFLYLPPWLLLLGTIGNVLSVVTLLRRSMRKTSTYNLLVVVATGDTLVLSVGLLRRWLSEVTGKDVRDQNDFTCKMISLTGYTVSLSSVWILIVVTAERYYITVHSLRAVVCSTRKQSFKIIALILLLMLLLNSHFLATTQIGYYEIDDDKILTCSSSEGYEYFVEHVWPWIDAMLYCFVPFFVISLLNGLIIKEIVESRRRRAELLQHQILSYNVMNENSTRLTLMLLCVTFIFLLCTLPMMATMIYASYTSLDDVNLEKTAKFTLARTCSEMLMYAHHSINFYVYLLSGSRFREELRKLMFCNNTNPQGTRATVQMNCGAVSPERVQLAAIITDE